MTQWFRSWHGAPTDPKWILIARKASSTPVIVSAIVWALFDHASQESERGDVTGFDQETYAAWAGIAEDEVNAVITALIDKGIIADGRLTAWEKRQPKREDDSRERVRAFRDRVTASSIEEETQCNASVTQRNAPEEIQSREDTEIEAPEGAAARTRETSPPELPPEIEDVTEAEWYVVECVQAVPGAAGLKPAEIVAELRESILNRGSPVTDELIRSQFQRFRNHWCEKRKSQRGKWRGWRNAISNWVDNIRDGPPAPARNGNGAYDPTAIWLEWAENPDEQDDIRQRHGPVIDVTAAEER